MFIKAISSNIPGFNDSDGCLVKTSDILSQISQSEDVDPFFIEKAIGIQSVSVTSDTFEAMQSKKVSTRNSSLYKMLGRSVTNTFSQYQENLNSTPQIAQHIHIVTFAQPLVEQELRTIRLQHKIDPSITSIILQQGCNGILNALELAEIFTKANPKCDILITAENNMMTHVHNRFHKYAGRKNINSWLWPVIFGEGVGALIVGAVAPRSEHPLFEVSSFHKETVNNDWRVTEVFEDDNPLVYIRAKEVKQTYMKAIPRQIASAAAQFSKDEIGHYLLHESNPNIIKQVTAQLDIPSEKTLSISAKVGTLACVSSFSLLDLASLNSLKNQQYDKIVLAVIGESGGQITAGYINIAPKFAQNILYNVNIGHA